MDTDIKVMSTFLPLPSHPKVALETHLGMKYRHIPVPSFFFPPLYTLILLNTNVSNPKQTGAGVSKRVFGVLLGGVGLAQLGSGRDPEKASNWPSVSLQGRVIGSNRGPRTSWPAGPFLPEPDPASGGLPSARSLAGAWGGRADGADQYLTAFLVAWPGCAGW